MRKIFEKLKEEFFAVLPPTLEFQLTRQIWTQVGWRYMKYDYRKNGFLDQNELNGLFLQTGMNF